MTRFDSTREFLVFTAFFIFNLQTAHHILTIQATDMNNFEILVGILASSSLLLSAVLLNKQLSRSKKSKSRDPWGNGSKSAQISDYFYIDQ